MLPLGPDDFMDRLLAAHGAEDAFEPSDDVAIPPGHAPAIPAPSVPPVDAEPVLGLLSEAERLCGIDQVRLHAAAAA